MSIIDAKSTTVVLGSIRNAKLAALYFDYVVPIVIEDVPRSLFPPGFESWTPASPLDVLRKAQQWAKTKWVAIPLPDGSHIKPFTADGEIDEEALEFVNELTYLHSERLQNKLRVVMNNAGLEKAPIFVTRKAIKPDSTAKTLSDVTITVAGLPIIQVDHTPWESILDLRNDSDSVKKLRRLNRYLAIELVGKTNEQIEAGIEQGIDDYESAAKKHGLTLLSSSLETTCDSKSLLSSIGGGALIGNAIGGNTAAQVGASVGLLLEFSKLTIRVSRGLYDMKALKREHPMAYIVDAQKSFK